jgi:hypothetical protein
MRRLLGGAVALWLALGASACTIRGGTFDLAAPISDGGPDAPAYVPCDSYCLRPGDCAFAYASDGLCPFGFLCARTFQCSSDGGRD